ncbi:FAD/NAD(P)-binding domain containing protein [Hyaloscypha variabilis]
MAPTLEVAVLHPEIGHLEVKTATPSLPTQTLKSANSAYVIQEEPIRTRRPLRVACMGAGYSGLMMAIVVSQKLQDSNLEFVVYERNKDLGGTWLENRYPGCQCDIPAHNYAYSFEQNPEWPNYYATSVQIYEYLKRTSSKYDADRYMKFGHEIKSAIWNESKANAWKYPDIEGITSFKGKLLHSASWDESYDFQNKKVAVIGIGSSGIQIVPKIAPIASHLTSFVRSKTWISPAPGINEPTENDPETDENHNYAPHVIQKFKDDPEFLLQHRRDVMDRRIDNFKRAHTASEHQRKAQELFKKTMTERLGNSEKGRKLAERLVPKFPVGCRRQTPGPNFLETLIRPNVETRWDDIAKITVRGILTRSGEELEFDAIVCATGFDTSFQPRFPVIGRGGASLGEQWEETPEAYFGIAVPNFPNYFSFIGPNFPISNGSLVLGVQAVSIYIYNCINKLQTENVRSMEVTSEANHDYNEHIQTYLQRTVWVENCRSWYKRGTTDGKVVAIYGGTTFHYSEAIRQPRWEDYKFESMPSGNGKLNRFSYLGNGYTKRETRRGTVGDTQTLTFEDYWNLFVLPAIYE